MWPSFLAPFLRRRVMRDFERQLDERLAVRRAHRAARSAAAVKGWETRRRCA